MSSVLEIVLSIVIIISVLYPIMFKFGSTNGRIILFVVVFAFVAIIGFVANYIDISFNTRFWFSNTVSNKVIKCLKKSSIKSWV